MPYFPPSQAAFIGPDTVDNTILANVPASSVKGRGNFGTGDPQDLNMTQLAAMLQAGGIGSYVPLSYRNILGRNGGCEVWQRISSIGATLAASGSMYAADGWFVACGANQLTNIAQGGSLAPGSRTSLSVSRNPGQTGTGLYWVEYPLDTDEIAFARSNFVTLSFLVYGGPNFSPTAGAFTASLYVGTGAPARRIMGAYAGETAPFSKTFNAALNTVTPCIVTSTAIVPGNATQASLVFQWAPVGTAGAQDYIAFDDVQLEVGTFATPFERRPFESELQACRRHFQKSFQYEIAPAQNTNQPGYSVAPITAAGANTNFFTDVRLQPPLRVAPSVTFYNPAAANGQVRNLNAGTDHSSTSAFVAGSSSFGISSVGAAGSFVGQAMIVHWAADAGI